MIRNVTRLFRKAVIVGLTVLGVSYIGYSTLAQPDYSATLLETAQVVIRSYGNRPPLVPTRKTWDMEDGKLLTVVLERGALWVQWKTAAGGGGSLEWPDPCDVEARRKRILMHPGSHYQAPTWTKAGLAWADAHFDDRIYAREIRSRVIELPMWFVVAALFAYPAVAFIRGPLRRYRRRRRGLCLACGYNLTGNESGVCPECGEEVEPE